MSQEDCTGGTVSPLCVIGLGNILLKDEGIGVHAANAVKERYAFSPDVDIIDGGTIGLDLLPIIEGRDRVMIVDAVDFGKEPGHIGIIKDKDIPSVLNSKLSVHHIGLSDVLFTAAFMDITPSEICLVGIQPKSLDVGLDMTPEIDGKMEDMINLIIKTLQSWGVECALRSRQESLK
ncbi:MAG TPA: hydrogenase expression/formation protein [Nitrospiraceae bacterium]|nr:MAG: hydrogenase expression/formation protein [Nitrospirae bacterium GWB2_47_37]HCL81557.1 hydrogenase expression/formation protein [Nitrospiraceae bacterium]